MSSDQAPASPSSAEDEIGGAESGPDDLGDLRQAERTANEIHDAEARPLAEAIAVAGIDLDELDSNEVDEHGG